MPSAISSKSNKTPLARLPFETREELCRRLRDGATWRHVAAWLESRGLHPPNAQNVTNFRKGPYRKWLRDQDRLDAIREKAEAIRRDLDAGGYSVLDQAICETAQTLAASELPADAVARAVAALKNAVTGADRLKVYQHRAHLAEQALELERDKFTAAQARAAQADSAEGVAADASLTPEEKERRMREIFGLS